jgi:hypothetical protein
VLPLRLDLRSIAGVSLNTACCGSPLELTTALLIDGAYDIEVILLTDWGRHEETTFEITTWVQEGTM